VAKIVHMTSVHIPFDTRVFHKECRSLAEAGHEVVLLATHDRSEVVEGVRVVGFPRRPRLGRMLRTTVDIYRRARAEDADVYHFHDPELLPFGWALARQGRRVIWDSHEDVTRQLLTKEWLPKVLRRPASRLASLVERRTSARFAAIISAEPTGAPRFRHPRVQVIQNWPRLAEFTAPESDYGTRPPEVVYVGSLTEVRGALGMVDAVNLLPEDLGARLRLAGTFGPPALSDEVARRNHFGRVEVLGQLSRPEVKELLGQARVGLVVLHPTPQFTDATQPVKLFEYMAAGVPFVASDLPVWRALVGESAGLYVDPLDPAAIADAIEWLLRHPAQAEEMGREGRRRVEADFSWDGEARLLLGLYDEVLGVSTRDGEVRALR
jgi:glycosyltransferase involved in cell wall biosynthesis